MNYHNKVFKPISVSDNGEVSSQTLFTYQQKDNLLTCTYNGGEIVLGHLIGLVDNQGNINMRYHQINKKGEIMTGKCITTPEILSSGKIRLHEKWEWTSGDGSSGESILEEI